LSGLTFSKKNFPSGNLEVDGSLYRFIDKRWAAVFLKIAGVSRDHEKAVFVSGHRGVQSARTEYLVIRYIQKKSYHISG
jgi:hypothetical protein